MRFAELFMAKGPGFLQGLSYLGEGFDASDRLGIAHPAIQIPAGDDAIGHLAVDVDFAGAGDAVLASAEGVTEGGANGGLGHFKTPSELPLITGRCRVGGHLPWKELYRLLAAPSTMNYGFRATQHDCPTGVKSTTDYGYPKNNAKTKPLPYTVDQQRALLHPSLLSLKELADSVNPALAPRGEICAKLTLHPEFLAKSYFPEVLLRHSALRLLGSRGLVVTPRAMVRGKAPRPGQTAALIVAGTAQSFETADEMLMSSAVGYRPRHVEFCRLERIEAFTGVDRVRVDLQRYDGWLEVSLHAALEDEDIRKAFTSFVHDAGGRLNPARMRTVGGLTFVPIEIVGSEPGAVIARLSDFSHLRLVRNMPLITVDPEGPVSLTRQLLFPSPALPREKAISTDVRVAIFDGGVMPGLLPWVRALDAATVPPSNPSDIAHGTHVTSAYLFGSVDEQAQTLQRPYTNVDHIRVLPSQSKDYRVLDVIDRIIDTLTAARDDGRPYELANLSLGPRMPIVDEDPHEWTVRLDDLLSLGDLFMTVAVGNDGLEGPDLGRIQPPSDAVNCFAVGASDRAGGKWQRADYSGIGPGRSPGCRSGSPDPLRAGAVPERSGCPCQ